MQLKALFLAYPEDWSRQVPPRSVSCVPHLSSRCPLCAFDILEQCLAQRDIQLGTAITQMIIGITLTDGRSEGEPLPPMQAGGQAFLLWQLEQR